MALRRVVRSVRAARQRARLRLWAARGDVAMRRRGGRLRVEADGAQFEALPRLRVLMTGSGGGTLTISLGPRSHIGRDVRIDVHLPGDSRLELGPDAQLHDGVRVDLRGGEITIGRFTLVHQGAVLKVAGTLEIGAECRVGYWTAVHCESAVTLGDHCGVGERVTFVDSNHRIDSLDVPFLHQPIDTDPIVLDGNVWIGANSVLTAGAHVERGAVIAAGGVAGRGRHRGGWLHAGVPVRPVKPFADAAP